MGSPGDTHVCGAHRSIATRSASLAASTWDADTTLEGTGGRARAPVAASKAAALAPGWGASPPPLAHAGENSVIACAAAAGKRACSAAAAALGRVRPYKGQ